MSVESTETRNSFCVVLFHSLSFLSVLNKFMVFSVKCWFHIFAQSYTDYVHILGSYCISLACGVEDNHGESIFVEI